MPKYGKDTFGNKWVWWAPNEIHYTRGQVEFILDNLNTLKDGRYPPDPSDTGYQNAGWKASINTKASFITPVEIYSEMDRRLLRCGMDWYLVHDHFEQGLTIEEIAKLHHLDYDDVWNRIQRAIAYVASGSVPRWVTIFNPDGTEKRKGLEYDDWHKHGYQKCRIFPKHRIQVSQT
jgi:hypothetical protein